MINLGSSPIASLKLGSTDVTKVMLGSTEVWSSWSPLDLAPALWLSDTGSDPGVWPDISGNGRNATQGTPANQPAIISGGLNGKQVRRFDGSNHWFNISKFMTGSATALFVCKRTTDPATTTATTGPVLGDWGTVTSQGVHFPWTDGAIYDHFGSNVRKTVGNPASPLTNWRMISKVSAPNDWRYYIDGALFYSTASNTVAWGNNPRIGASYFNSYKYYGDIAEILVFPSALSNTDRLAVETYLATKWGITLT
jgi:hypothetical protein